MQKLKKCQSIKLKTWAREIAIQYPIDNQGNVERNENEVFDRSKTDFEKLYNCTDQGDERFYNDVKTHKQLLEEVMLDPLYESNTYLNINISIEETTQVVMNAKSHSASGCDQNPYIVLKFPAVICVIYQRFQLIFD
jgi:hypothetical protein